MATQPQFIQKRLARKTSDITRLLDQYKGQVNAMAGEYEQSFAQYNAKRAETLLPYEAAVSQYQTQVMPEYEAALGQYQAKYDSYLEQLKALEADPVTARTVREVVGKTWYGKKEYADVTYFDPKPIPKFEEKAPTAPDAPMAPTVEAFDTTQFDTKRAELESGLKRELGERKAAKVNAVGRKQARPLLQGAAT